MAEIPSVIYFKFNTGYGEDTASIDSHRCTINTTNFTIKGLQNESTIK